MPRVGAVRGVGDAAIEDEAKARAVGDVLDFEQIGRHAGDAAGHARKHEMDIGEVIEAEFFGGMTREV